MMIEATVYAIIDVLNGEVVELAKNKTEAETMREKWVDHKRFPMHRWVLSFRLP